MSQAPRNHALDVLRFLAVILVLFHHMTPWPPPPYPFGVGALLHGLTGGGWCGVDLFFVLSGFLVSGLLFNEYKRLGAVSFTRFFVRRGLKIYPAFYVMLAVYGTLDAKMTHTVTLSKVLSEALFVQNYRPEHIFNHTWSLAVEEHFYLFIGVVTALLASRKAMRWLPALCVLTFPLCLFLRFACYIPGVEESGIYASHTRMDSLAFGVLLSYVSHFHPATFARLARYRLWLTVVAILAVLPVFMGSLTDSEYLQTVGLTVNYLAFGALVALASLPTEGQREGRVSRTLALLGSYSYSVYLWHMFVKRALSLARKTGWLELPYAVELALFIVISFALGIAMAKLVEIPVLRLRDRYWPSRERPTTA